MSNVFSMENTLYCCLCPKCVYEQRDNPKWIVPSRQKDCGTHK